MAFWPKVCFAKFEMAFWSEMAVFCYHSIFFSNESALSIERFGLLLMAESFQACYLKIL